MSRFATVAGERVAELAELCADAGRLSRGRTMFRKGSVGELSIIEGSVIASVVGSGGDEYETTVGTALASPSVVRQVVQGYDPANPRGIDDLIDGGIDVCPRESDLAFACDCADWDEPCKHVVALLLALADRVDLDETELFRWRGIDPTDGPDGASPTSRRPTGAGATEGSPQDQQDSRTAKLSELEALLGDTRMRVPADDADRQARVDGGRSAPAIDPVYAEFLGIDMTLEPIDVTDIAAPAPLFNDVQLGPLADLGPELAAALGIIVAGLEDVAPLSEALEVTDLD